MTYMLEESEEKSFGCHTWIRIAGSPRVCPEWSGYTLFPHILYSGHSPPLFMDQHNQICQFLVTQSPAYNLLYTAFIAVQLRNSRELLGPLTVKATA